MLPAICTPETTSGSWEIRRRELVELFAAQEFGRRPQNPYQVTATLTEQEDLPQLSATREHYEVAVRTRRGLVILELSLVLPRQGEQLGAVLLLSNHDRAAAPGQSLDMSVMTALMENAPPAWREATMKMFAGMQASGPAAPSLLDIDKDFDQGYWAVREILASGRAAAAFYASQAQPDNASQFPASLSALFLDPEAPREPDGWGTLGVWAFAASCMVDVLTQHPRLNPERICLGGHSRGGKTALWCAAQDSRIHAVLVNNSGCSGAALSRGKEGEVVASINAFFPHWFCPNYRQYGWKEDTMPFDQHMLLACVAPRLCYVTSGSEDSWSDPNAEWQGAVEASQAWALFGHSPLEGSLPAPGQWVHSGPIGYHLRQGGHDLTAWDWARFLEFLDANENQ